MLSRRSVLSNFLLGSISRTASSKPHPPCTYDDDVTSLRKQMEAFPTTTSSNPGDFQPDVIGTEPRPLWSNLLKDTTAYAAYSDTLLRAYKKMGGAGPTGLNYQGWLHWYRCPKFGERESIHNNSAFLPWHRAY